MMIRASAIGLLAATAVSSAMAADLIVEEDIAEVAMAAAHDWSGPYIGVHGGFGAGTVEQLWDFGDVDDPATPDDTIDIDGWLLGAHAGVNFQSGAFVGGIEALVDYAPLIGDDGGSFGDTNQFESKWLGTLAGRVGFAADSALFYLSGGVAVLSADVSVTNVGDEETVGYTFLGGTVGAGAEFAFDENVSARLDYRYYAFGAETEFLPINGYSVSQQPSFHTITAGLSVGF